MTHPHLRNRFVHIMGPDGIRVSRLARVWWKGDRPSRVVTVSGESMRVVGVAAPGEIFRTRRWVLRVAPEAIKVVGQRKRDLKKAA